MLPAIEGPVIQPKSPNSARKANIETPPPGIIPAALLMLPGQSTPTEKPHIPQANRETMGNGENAAVRYEIMQSIELKSINFLRLILELNFA